MVKNERGFTLVELIISVLILAIAIVIAVPKMVDQQNLKERVVVDQAAGYFGSAVSLGRAAWVVAGRPGTAANLPGFRQGTFDFNKNGWPVGVGAAGASDMTASSCAKLWTDIQDFERTVTALSSGEDADFIASGQQGTCVYELSEDKGRYIHYNTYTGKIMVTNA